MDKRDLFEGATSTNGRNFNQDDAAKQSSDNDVDRKSEQANAEEKSATDEAYFNKEKKNQ
ncbi:MAG: hypothetical protein JWN76_2066 [Chitinophagaceae bacterium]|nr:hypothetical protein [Chitinophagaceae bacterium]